MRPDENNEPVVNENEDYINAINELKQNTVDKAKYDKLKAENKQLLDTLVSGGQLAPAEKPVDIDELRKDLFTNQNLNNLQYCEKALELRKAIMDEGGRDPFVPAGSHATVEDSDYATAEKVATILQECIDYAEGNSEVFTMELNRRMSDYVPARRR